MSTFGKDLYIISDVLMVMLKVNIMNQFKSAR